MNNSLRTTSQGLHYALLLFFSFVLSTTATAKDILVHVYNTSDKQPLSYATVEISSPATPTKLATGVTDLQGNCKLMLNTKTKSVAIKVSYLGFTSVQQLYTLPISGEEKVRIGLREQEKKLREVLVQGLSAAERVQRQAYNVSFIETDKLKNTTMDLGNVIDQISGVKVRSTGGVGADANITLNGFSGRHIKLFIDGVPMEGMSAAFGIQNIPATLAKRVEVYKGVVPIELGGDAIGGAVNIITDASKRTRVNASYSFGSFNTHKTNVYAAYTSKRGWHVSLNAYQNYADNDYKVDIDHYTHFGPKGNSIRRESLRVRRFHAQYHNEAAVLQVGVLNQPFADRLLLGFTGGHEYKQTQNASNMNWVYGARYTTAATLMPQLMYEKHFDVMQGLMTAFNANYNFGQSYAADTASANYNWLGERSQPKSAPGELAYTDYRYRDNNAAANLHLSLHPTAGQAIALSTTLSSFSRAGKDLTRHVAKYDHPQQRLKVVSGISYKYQHRERWNTTAFAKHYINYLAAYLDPTGGSKYQEYHNTTSYWGGGLAATYFAHAQVQLRLSYEYALRLPSSRELFGSGDDIERGNALIKPETSNNINLSITATPLDNDLHRLTLDAALQYRNIQDYIRRTTNNDNGRATSKNDGGVRNYSGDFGLRYTYTKTFFIGANFSYIDMRSRTKYVTGTQRQSKNYKQRIPAIPYIYGNADAGFTLRDIGLKGTVLDVHYMLNYIHAFSYEWNTYGNTDVTVPTQWAHDLFASYSFGRKQAYTVSAECTNLLNARRYDNYKMQKPGRAFAIKFSYRFSK